MGNETSPRPRAFARLRSVFAPWSARSGTTLPAGLSAVLARASLALLLLASTAHADCPVPDFNNPDCIVEPPPERDANPAGMSVPTAMQAGQYYPVMVKFLNTGSATWTAAEGYKLGSAGPQDNWTWGLARVGVPGSIASQQEAAFYFTVRAPETPGRYTFQWRMLMEGVEWFGPATSGVAVDVYGGSISASPSTCTIPWGASTCTVRLTWSSNAPNAQVVATLMDGSGAQTVAAQQNGSIDINWVNSGGFRFHLKSGSMTLSTVEARGVHTVNQAPSVSLTSPASGQQFQAPTQVALAATASDGDDGVQRVEFHLDGAKIAEDTSAPYQASWNAVAGNHSVMARVFDTRGASADSSYATVSVAPPVPPVAPVSRKYVYDPQQRLCKVIEPETGATVTEYDEVGNVAWTAAGLNLPDPASCNRSEAAASGRAVTRSYDGRNRLQTLNFPDGRGNQSWEYYPDGLAKTVTTSNEGAGQGTVVNSYNYDKRRNLTAEAQAQPGWYTWSSGYGYEPDGQLRWHSYPTGTVIDYAPNALGQPRQVATTGQTYASNVRYYPNGAVSQFTYGNGIVHAMTQNARQLPLRSTDAGALDLQTRYDPNGNVIEILDLARGETYGRWMTYDDLDRLIAAGSCSFGGDCWHRFKYDALDNIKSWSLGGVKDHRYYYDPSNRLTNVQNASGASVIGLGYDVQGNLENKNGQVYAFDYGNRLRRVTGKEIYRYDALGRRVLSVRDDWSTTNRLSMYNKAGQMIYTEAGNPRKSLEHYYLGSSLLAIRENDWAAGTPAIVRYQHTDALGSPAAVTDAAGAVIERTDWEPYGAAIGKPNYDGVGYTGHVMDGGSGLTYMQQRYYDSLLGRFLSVDPVTAYDQPLVAFNRYRYGNNDPYKFTDPDGRFGRPDPPHMWITAVGKKQNTDGSVTVQRMISASDTISGQPTGGAVVLLPQRSAEGAPAKVGDAVQERLLNFSEKAGKIVEVTSGQRTVEQNAAVGGAPASQHLNDNAADISIQGNTPTQTADAAYESGEFNRVNEYTNGRGVHVDLRENGNQGRFDNWRPRANE
nr:Ig-like domain-containing protein [Lysobacter sp. BMK333-48F3]